jgi:hypothetical protein
MLEGTEKLSQGDVLPLPVSDPDPDGVLPDDVLPPVVSDPDPEGLLATVSEADTPLELLNVWFPIVWFPIV